MLDIPSLTEWTSKLDEVNPTVLLEFNEFIV